MNVKKTMLLSTAFLSSFAWVPTVFADITMGVFPRRPAAVTITAFKPLAEHLSTVLGEKVNLVVPKDFKAFWAGVKSGKFDLVHYNQYHYIKSHKELGFEVIAVNEEQGKKKIAGALSVRKDSGINSVKDLKGKTILFGGGKKAMGSYIAPLAILKKAGLTEGKDFTARFAKNPPSAVIGVFNKAGDAAGSGNIILNVGGVKKKIDVSQMKILAESDSFIHLAWAVKKGFSKSKTKKIQKAMTSLSASAKGKKVLKSAKVTNFHLAKDTDFKKVREITKYALGESL